MSETSPKDRSRFDPDIAELRRIAKTQQDRAERLSRRLTEVRRAVLSGQSKEALLALIGGGADV